MLLKSIKKHLKENQKGFTLIEIIVVFAILAILFGIASFSVFGFLNKGQNTAYNIAENTLEDAASAALTDCLTGANNEFCSKYSLPQNKYDFQLVYLDDLIENEYVDPIKDPNDSSQYCDLEKSYVYITNRADMSTSKNYDLQYKVCLICGDTESEYCRENIDAEGDFASVCHIYYDEAGTIPYDNKWTDKELYLKFTSEGNFKLGISRYEYQIKGDTRWTSVDTPQNIDTITVQVKNTTASKEYQVKGFDDFKRVGVIGTCTTPDGTPATIKIDKEKVISASISAKKATAGTTVSAGTWSNENLTLTATGNPTSVVSGYTYQWYKDGLAISGATNKTYTATETGMYKVKITNGVGSQSVTSPEYNAKIDKVKPVISNIENPSNENWTDQSFALTLTVTETQSMIDYYQYKYEDTEWKKYENSNTSPFTTTEFSKERDEYVYLQVVDIAGNKSEIAKTMIRIDKTGISTVTLAGKTTNGTAVSSGTWKAENIILTGTVNPTSVISGYTYQWYKDGTAISGATSLTYTATETGNYTLKVTSGVGKTKTSSAFDVKIDKTVLNTTTPTITASDGKASGAWHTANFTLTPSGVTSPSGITYYYGTSSSSVNNQYTTPISVSTNTASQTYYFKACNKAGTCTNVSSYTVKLDKSTMGTKPTITASDGKTSGSWHTANFTLTPSGVSSTSGVTYYYGTTSGNLTTKYTTAVSISENTAGITYYFKACNGAGTCSGESSYQAKLDKATLSAPTISASDGKASGAWHIANFTLTPSGITSTSGITYYYGTSTSSVNNKYTTPVSISTNTASQTYYFKACNGAGTCSSNASYVVKLDKETPAIPTITASDGLTTGTWHTSNFTLTFSGATSIGRVTYYYGTSASSMTSTGSSVSISTNTAGTTYYVKACNEAGTCSTSNASYIAKLDKGTPSTPTITANDGITSGYWHKANVTLSFSGATSTSGITYYYGTSASSMTSTGSSVSITSNTTGVTYYVKACNGAGTCSGNASYQVKLDKSTPAAPTISAKKATAGTVVSSGAWSNQDLSVTVSGSSAISTISYYQYCTDTANTCTPNTTYSSAVTLSSTGYIRFRAVSGSGVAGTVASYNAKIDKATITTPTITASDGKASGTWHTADVTLTFSGASSTSGITYYYGTATNSMSSTGTSVSYTSNTSGVTYYVKACNGAGTCSSNASYQIKLDKATPATPTITATDGIGSGSWHKANVTLNFSGASSTSGITYYYGTSTSSMTSTGSSVSITSNTSSTTYYVKACNGAGTCSTSNASYVVKLDKSTPGAPTISAKKASVGTAVSSGAWSNQNLSVTVSGSSAISTISYYQYCTDTTNTCTPSTTYSGAITLSSTGYIRFRAVSGSGVAGTVASYNAKIDKSAPSAPTITATDGKASGAWHTANVTLNFSGSSANSGITYYYGTSTSSMTSTGSSVSYTSNTSGVTYYVKACNGAGICSANSSYQIKLDKATLSAPTITASDGITSGYWHTANVTLNFSGASSTSGVTYYYGTSTSPSTAGSSLSYTSNTAGTTYYVKVCNGAGTCSGNSSYQIKLDKSTMSTAPTITASDSIGSGSWHTANFTLSFSGVSSTSGVTYYYGTSSSPSTAGSSVSISSATSGTTYYAKVCNGAGKCSGNSSYSVKLDKTNPTISYNVAGGTYTTTKTVTITASDTNFSYMNVHVYKDGSYVSGKSVSNRTSNTYSVSLDSAGSWVIYAQAFDQSGRTQNQSPNNGSGWYYQSYTLNLSYAATKNTYTATNTAHKHSWEAGCYETQDGSYHTHSDDLSWCGHQECDSGSGPGSGATQHHYYRCGICGSDTGEAYSSSCNYEGEWSSETPCYHDVTVCTLSTTPVYSCPSGGSLSGTTCTYYTCPNGGTLSGTTCYY